MILEVATLNIKSNKTAEFERVFNVAKNIIASSPGYIGHELHQCIEASENYILLVQWESVEAHEIGFRGSAEYGKWKALLGPLYSTAPSVLHYKSLPIHF